MTARNVSEANPDLLDGLIPEVEDDDAEEPSEDDVKKALMNLSAKALKANPKDWEKAKGQLREVLQAMGELPDPEALGCNLGDNFCDGSTKIKKNVRQSRSSEVK